MKEEVSDFRSSVLKLNEPRTHKIRNSNGVYHSYKYFRKNKWFGLSRPVTEHEFYTIIRKVNGLLVESFLQGNDIIFPYNMGRIELRKYPSRIEIKDGKIHTNLPIDWGRTIKLWSEDEDAYNEKLLIKLEEKEIFKVLYNKGHATYKNKSFYSFKCNRDLKLRLKQKIKNKEIDAFKLYG